MNKIFLAILMLFSLYSYAGLKDLCPGAADNAIYVSGDGGPWPYVSSYTGTRYNRTWVVESSGRETYRGHVNFEVLNYNGFQRGQVVHSETMDWPGQDARILHLFDNGVAQISMIGNHSYGNGYIRLVEVGNLSPK